MAQNWQTMYEKGKNEIKNKNYKQAQITLEPLARTSPAVGYQRYGAYLYALAAYHNKDFATARQILRTLLEQQPTWEERQEVLLLAATVAFEEKQTSQGFEYLKNITSANLKEPIFKMKKNVFQNYPTERIQALYQNYPQDRAIAEVLADKLAQNPNQGQAKKLLEEIKIKFSYSPIKSNKEESVTPIETPITQIEKKSKYQIGVFLPFFSQGERNLNIERDYQFAVDLYAGMAIAKTILANEGVEIDLLPFDTERSEIKLKSYLNQENTKNLDLLVGALYPNTLPLLSDFGRQHNIPILNPISSNSDLSQSHALYFLFEPSERTQAQQAAAFALNQLSRKNAYIIYDENKKNETMAAYYRDFILKNGGEVRLFHQTQAGNKIYSNLQQALKELAPRRTGAKSDLEELDPDAHIVVFTSEAATAGTFVSIIDASGKKIPTIITNNWFNFTQINADHFENLNFYVIYPDFIDGNKPEVKEFFNLYWEKNNTFPSDFSYIGFESIYYFGKMLGLYGKQLPQGIRQQDFMQGKVMLGHDYRHSTTDNKFVPILQWKKGEGLILSNDPSQNKN